MSWHRQSNEFVSLREKTNQFVMCVSVRVCACGVTAGPHPVRASSSSSSYEGEKLRPRSPHDHARTYSCPATHVRTHAPLARAHINHALALKGEHDMDTPEGFQRFRILIAPNSRSDSLAPVPCSVAVVPRLSIM